MMTAPGYDFATVNGTQVSPRNYLLLFHGTADVSLDGFMQSHGLPAKGQDIELVRHVEPAPGDDGKSAFRGTTQLESFPPDYENSHGAAAWAREGGLVYQICDFPGYDVQLLLDGRIPDGMGGFRGPKYREQEVAIPARVGFAHVQRIGQVVEKRRGMLVKWTWDGPWGNV